MLNHLMSPAPFGLKGFWLGGVEGYIVHTAISGLHLPSETALNPAATLTVGRFGGTGFGNLVNGYVAGGGDYALAPKDVIDRFAYSSETVSALSATIGTARTAAAGFHSRDRGYAAAGSYYQEQAAASYNEISGIKFSDESAVSVAATTASSGVSVGFYSNARGYCNTNRVESSSDISGIAFSDESASNPSASLSAYYRSYGSFVQQSLFGWSLGTSGSSRFRFNDETVSTVSATIGATGEMTDGCQSHIKGYAGGGGSGDYMVEIGHTTITALFFGDQTTTVISTTLADASSLPASITYGTTP